MPKSNGRESPLSAVADPFSQLRFYKKEWCRRKHAEKSYVFTADTISMEGARG